jgi:hypothetical protein
MWSRTIFRYTREFTNFVQAGGIEAQQQQMSGNVKAVGQSDLCITKTDVEFLSRSDFRTASIEVHKSREDSPEKERTAHELDAGMKDPSGFVNKSHAPCGMSIYCAPGEK